MTAPPLTPRLPDCATIAPEETVRVLRTPALEKSRPERPPPLAANPPLLFSVRLLTVLAP